MQKHRISHNIKRKIDNWLESISDSELKNDLKDNVIVTGGCIASMLLGEQVNDYDVYIRDKAVLKRLAEYYVTRFKENPPKRFKNQDKNLDIIVEDKDDRVYIRVQSSGVVGESNDSDYEYFETLDAANEMRAGDFVEAAINSKKVPNKDESPKYKPVFITGNAITLSDKIQIIVRFHGEARDIHENFDFIHCKNYWRSDKNRVYLFKPALESLLSKQLIYNNSKYPICSIMRMRKFIKRGWNIHAGQILKIALQITGLDLTDIKVLEDQLMGVDSAYFKQIINILRNDKVEKIDTTYLMELIDKVFE